MLLIYRVEKKDGTGPWCRTDGEWTERGGSLFSSPINMSISTRRVLDKHKQEGCNAYRFGFQSTNQMFKYINITAQHVINNLRDLEGAGYYIGVYKVDSFHCGTDVVSDHTQCLFDPKEMHLIKHFSCMDPWIMRKLHEYRFDTDFLEREIYNANRD